MDRQRLDSGARITVKLVEDRLQAKDIDSLMRRWLQVDDRVSHVTPGDRQDDRQRRDDHRNRYTREVAVEDMEVDSERIAAVGEAVKGKQKARSAEVHPKKGKEVEGKTNEKEPERSKPPHLTSMTPRQVAPPQVPAEVAPQWIPAPQWWYGNQWQTPMSWTPDWSSWGGGKGAGYAGGGQPNWWTHKGGKGDKGGTGVKGRKGGQNGSGASTGGRGKGGERQ